MFGITPFTGSSSSIFNFSVSFITCISVFKQKKKLKQKLHSPLVAAATAAGDVVVIGVALWNEKRPPLHPLLDLFAMSCVSFSPNKLHHEYHKTHLHRHCKQAANHIFNAVFFSCVLRGSSSTQYCNSALLKPPTSTHYA